MYAQYEGAMLPVKRYSKACQTANVIVHEELFWARSVIEELQAPFFVMYKNISEYSSKEFEGKQLYPCVNIIVMCAQLTNTL
jgi:hypothetical protein